jgi:(p)ppGpp synthase/HD superfamily hydrolase
MDIAEFDALAESAHAGQVDKAGKPYVGHLRRVRNNVSAIIYTLPEGMMSEDEKVEAEIAALGHDIVEDTDETEDSLRARGVPGNSVRMIGALSKNDWHGTYQEYIEHIAAHGSLGTLIVKLGDNQDNNDPERIAQLPPEGRSISRRYDRAKATLQAELERRVLAFLSARPTA